MSEENVTNNSMPLLVSAAHELKAPLALIRQLALSVECDYSGNLNAEEIKEYMRQIALTAERSLRLTSDFTRSVNKDQLRFELEPINLRPLLDDVAHEVWPLFKSKNKKLELCYGNPGLALANHDLLRRILVNFADNALHYSFEGETVTLRAQAHGSDGVRCGVRDYGPAVSKDTWKKFQNELGKRPQAFHSRPQSSGLGLFIAEQFATAMAATIGATRHRDGATFYVDLKASHQLNLF